MRKVSIFESILRDRGGNFGLITAILAPVLLGVAGIAIDVTRAVQIRAEMQGLADSAVLAAATSISNRENFTEANARDLAKTFYATQIVQLNKSGSETEAEIAAQVKAIKDATTVTIVTKANGVNGKTFDISIKSSYEMKVNALTALIAGPSVTLATQGASYSATESQNAFSMYLVLDQSSSMNEDTNTLECTKTNNTGQCTSYGYIKKMDALKSAVKSLAKVIDEADPGKIYARLAAVSYNSKMQTPVTMAWGTKTANDYAQALRPSGTTNSGEATQLAYDTLAPTGNGSENQIHKNKNNQTPSKFIILMTDGANNVANADTKTKAACDLARKDKNNKITVYSVAFMAPKAGQTLLQYCASTPAQYFNAENSADLVAAFKAIGEEAAKGMTRLTQ